ncbi:MAG: guanylate kinase [Bacteroidota bacterium]
MEMKQGKVFIISAPSGAGKSTLARILLQKYDFFEFSISATTRPPRSYETEGVDYHFLSADIFRQKIMDHAFLEWEEVYPGRFYGTLQAEVDRILAAGRYPVFDVDVEGGLSIKEKYAEQAVSIFIMPPSREILKDRLRKRGTESESDIEKRYKKAEVEIAYASRYDHVVLNDELDHAVSQLMSIVDSHLQKA